jgi:hypothetical protein
MGRDDLFYVGLLRAIREYHSKAGIFGSLTRPDDVIDKFWVKVQENAKLGIKPAAILLRDGFPKFQNFFRWAARDHHVVEIIKLIARLGELNSGKALWEHAVDHHKV